MNFLNRIKKIEASLLAVPAGAVLLREPPTEATKSEHSEHSKKVSDSLRDGITVIVVRNGVDRLRCPGVTYTDNEFDGLLALFAATPADGYPSALDKLIRDVQGTALQVFHEVSP